MHDLNPVRIKYIRDAGTAHFGARSIKTAKPFAGLKLLDVGCGGGLVVEPLARLGGHVTGIDPSPENIAIASAHAKLDPAVSNNVSYRAVTVQKVSDEVSSSNHRGCGSNGDNMFDIVTCLEVVEHVPLSGRKDFIQSIIKCIKPGGMLFMSTLNRTSKAYALAIVGAEHLLNLVPVGTHDWSKFMTPHELVTAIQEEGMIVKDTAGIIINPVTMRWSLQHADVDVNYILYATKPL